MFLKDLFTGVPWRNLANAVGAIHDAVVYALQQRAKQGFYYSDMRSAIHGIVHLMRVVREDMQAGRFKTQIAEQLWRYREEIRRQDNDPFVEDIRRSMDPFADEEEEYSPRTNMMARDAAYAPEYRWRIPESVLPSDPFFAREPYERMSNESWEPTATTVRHPRDDDMYARDRVYAERGVGSTSWLETAIMAVLDAYETGQHDFIDSAITDACRTAVALDDEALPTVDIKPEVEVWHRAVDAFGRVPTDEEFQAFRALWLLEMTESAYALADNP